MRVEKHRDLREPLKASKHANLGHEMFKPSTHTIIRMIHKGSHHKIDQPPGAFQEELGKLEGSQVHFSVKSVPRFKSQCRLGSGKEHVG